MALSKDLKEKIISRHIEMFDALLRGDIDVFATWWADDIIIYGTAISEAFTNKQDAIDFYKSTSDQVTGLVRMENRKINVHEQNGYVILTEKLDFHVKLAEEWTFYHHSRLTGVWSEINGDWYVTHIHCSFPDGYAGEGQQINPEQLRSENIKLQAAVEARTAELAQKNRELEIEIALDKIRTRSLSMHQSNEILEVAYLVSEKLKELSLGIDAVAIILTEGKRYEYWIANDEGSYATKIIEELNELNPSMLAKAFIKHQGTHTDFTFCAEGEDKKIHWEYLFSHTGFSIVPPERRQFILDQPYYNICASFHDHISLTVVRYNNKEYSESERAVVKKFCKVFAQAYTRFMDLYTAEKQAKEAKIEAALERVRAKSNAMQRTDNLLEVIEIVSAQLEELGISFTHVNFRITEGENDWDLWSHFKWLEAPVRWQVKYFDHPLFNRSRNNPNRKVHQEVFTLEEKISFEAHLAELGLLPAPTNKEQDQAIQKYLVESTGFAWAVYRMDKLSLAIANNKGQTYNDEEQLILKRFAEVFYQSYTRFLDLKKAEEQAREAEINLAVEKVKAKALAMHHSDEIMQVVVKLKEEVMGLHIPHVIAASILLNEGENKVRIWDLSATELSAEGSHVPLDITFQLKEHDPHLYVKRVWENPEDFFIEIQDQKGFERLLEWACEHGKKEVAEEVKAFIEASQIQRLYHAAKKLNHGKLVIDLLDPPTAEIETILTKMGAAFDLAYTRFLDLKKAEAQTREAQIEAALEKVRSASLSMQKSEDLPNVVETMEEKLLELGLKVSGGISITIFVEGTKDFLNCLLMLDRKEKAAFYYQNYFDTQAFRDFYDARANGEAYINKVYNEVDSREHIDSILAQESFKQVDPEVIQWMQNKNVYAYAAALMKYTGLFVFYFDREYLSQDFASILQRFANAFEQAYIRFLDLKKAEEQAQEAKIEAALERVRSRTMAMQRSEELSVVAHLLFEEFKALYSDAVHILSRAFVITVDEEAEKFTFFITTADGEYLQTAYPMPFNEPTNGVPLFQCWKNQNDLLINELEGEVFKLWLNYLDSIEFYVSPEVRQLNKRVNNYARFAKGFIGITSVDKLNDFGLVLLQRFTKVFDQTYTRFLDLQKAEEQARESKIEAALEKVRSRTLAMQHSDELAETAAEVFHQLISLGIEPSRLYIGIVNDVTKDMEMWATDEDGTGVGKKFTFNAADNASVKKLYDGWVAQLKSVTVDMQGAELENYISYLQTLQIPLSHALTQKRRIQSVAYFDKGFIGMALPDGQSEANIHLLERFAAVFNLTFTRFNDLKIAEAHALQAEQDLIAIKEAKQKAEAALMELKATQNQLIQAEKMASLGELTAGIAHEIQNPLNFVNNFSEVSQELIDEMNAEMANGNYQDAEQLAIDVKENLNKIHHHGKRADAIVKGMLQHSRTSSGKKEPTDINALCDEYLRLAYHGLRAKDKSFNAKFETKLDPQVGVLDIVPQDIGRVLLNLINNAFYATDERKKKRENSYEPMVIVETKKFKDSISIAVTDNGAGMPDGIKEKIFQPFFTTKPTGKGTGLGLSLSYDIVKAHGGNFSVESRQGEFTRFTILIPLAI
ncbi:MAG: ATP-binding protein [Sediminibacterium sp.]|jgi:signal transduction histidine kinase|nr:ATP-binding protein [Sediminibacterium sp.]